jgi:hypothetical protein
MCFSGVFFTRFFTALLRIVLLCTCPCVCFLFVYLAVLAVPTSRTLLCPRFVFVSFFFPLSPGVCSIRVASRLHCGGSVCAQRGSACRSVDFPQVMCDRGVPLSVEGTPRVGLFPYHPPASVFFFFQHPFPLPPRPFVFNRRCSVSQEQKPQLTFFVKRRRRGGGGGSVASFCCLSLRSPFYSLVLLPPSFPSFSSPSHVPCSRSTSPEFTVAVDGCCSLLKLSLAFIFLRQSTCNTLQICLLFSEKKKTHTAHRQI